MASTVNLVLLVFAFVCFVLAAWMPTSPQWQRLIAAGLAAVVASRLWP